MATIKRLEHIQSLSNSKEQVDKYQGLIDELLERTSHDGNTDDIELVLGQCVAHAVCRPCVHYFAEAVKNLSGELMHEVALKAISAIKNSANSYDEADWILREALFSFCVSQELFSEAGQVLSGLNLDSAQKLYTDSEKVDIYIRCAEAFLEDGQGAEAEIFMNRASPLMHAVEEWSLQLRYSVTLARVLDSNRKFLDASVRYFNLSNTQNKEVCQDDLLELYAKAITCAVLAKAGPQRERVIASLRKDDRLGLLDNFLPQYASHSAMLQKMHLLELVREKDMEIFEQCLQPHQKAMTSEGFTMPQKATIEHNMIAIRRLYRNIYISELAHLLGLDEGTTEKVAASMISEGRLQASLDQLEGMIYFTGPGDVEEDCRGEWIESIRETCKAVSEEMILSKEDRSK